MQCSIIFIILVIIFGRSLSQRSEVVKSQCSGDCYGALKQVLEYVGILNKRIESWEAKQPADTLSKIVQVQEKLAKLERQVAIQQELSRTADTSSKLALLEEKLDVLRNKTATLPELENTLSKFALMDEKLEGFKNQIATQPESKSTVLINALLNEKLETLSKQTAATQQELENTLSKISLVDEKLETLRKQTATQQELKKTSKQSADTFSKMAQMEEKLAALRKQTAPQQEFQSRLLRFYPSQYFEKIGSKYYYIEQNIKLTWHDALKKCHEMGAHLASLQSQNELTELGRQLKINLSYWIDLNDLETEGVYISATTGKKGTFFDFWGNESRSGPSENCVDIYKSVVGIYAMCDDPCEVQYRFICEKSFD